MTGHHVAAGPTAGLEAAVAPADVCAVVLAAGEGRRLRPLTEHLPKALCPVGNVALLDRALARLAALGFDRPARVAVNACYLGDQVVRHVGGRAHLSVEPGDPLGTAGGIANLRDWIDGRGVLVGNADAYLAHPTLGPGPDIAALLAGWDRRTVRLLGQPMADPAERGGFSGRRFAGFSLLPWRYVRDLPVAHAELVRPVWRAAEAAGDLTVIRYDGTYLDTGTPADYLAANLHAAARSAPPADPQVTASSPRPAEPPAAANGASDPAVDAGNLIDPTATVTGSCREAVVGAGAVVRGSVRRCVIWPGATVGEGERLADAIRVGSDLTVPAGVPAGRPG
ncbi:NTP transferase domain-containing protein [Solwaraspora sp. WMMD1047]|uniref:nucleotidyltransferase family protein n=1 Tax=Solwaraspora sp. WMMD1047 TaxID=3016102 RepID=UPI00241699D5|nr:sugar phosphate nucleotidyltransferase [Solwaraspora sp. WMMD1047]MDG4832248.1 NTP transferase domain-containing protein [Solwaraspora sp. WMMD1047]